jgi:hypothetical protein
LVEGGGGGAGEASVDAVEGDDEDAFCPPVTFA